MDILLTPVEARVLGALIEKELTTPENYPLSLNSLLLACNQKSNREPVMNLDESDIATAVDNLRNRYHLALERHEASARVVKYEHCLPARWQLSGAQVACVCVLLLRAAQTVGEIKLRTARLHPFASLGEVEQTLESLATREQGALVMRLPRPAGARESRYAHLLCGEPPAEAEAHQEEPEAHQPHRSSSEANRLEALEQQVSALTAAFSDLQEQFARFRQQFE
jgi:uncharacterized protein YceH (UPF0502 family)